MSIRLGIIPTDLQPYDVDRAFNRACTDIFGQIFPHRNRLTLNGLPVQAKPLAIVGGGSPCSDKEPKYVTIMWSTVLTRYNGLDIISCWTEWGAISSFAGLGEPDLIQPIKGNLLAGLASVRRLQPEAEVKVYDLTSL